MYYFNLFLSGQRSNKAPAAMSGYAMTAAQTRRSLLRRASLAVFGSIGLSGAVQRAYGSMRQSRRGYRSTAIEAVRGQQVSVPGGHDWIPLECVPPGWQGSIG